jgi:hypothetical protein
MSMMRLVYIKCYPWFTEERSVDFYRVNLSIDIKKSKGTSILKVIPGQRAHVKCRLSAFCWTWTPIEQTGKLRRRRKVRMEAVERVP